MSPVEKAFAFFVAAAGILMLAAAYAIVRLT